MAAIQNFEVTSDSFVIGRIYVGCEYEHKLLTELFV